MSKRVRKALSKSKALKEASRRILMASLKLTRQELSEQELILYVRYEIQFLEDNGFIERANVTRKP
jgi:hypothetical protein